MKSRAPRDVHQKSSIEKKKGDDALGGVVLKRHHQVKGEVGDYVREAGIRGIRHALMAEVNRREWPGSAWNREREIKTRENTWA